MACLSTISVAIDHAHAPSIIYNYSHARVHLVLIVAHAPQGNEHEQRDENGERNHAAFLLRLEEALCTLLIGAMPIGESQVLLVAVLLCAMCIAHALTAALEEHVDATASHSLVAVPVGSIIAHGHTVRQLDLAIQAGAERVAVLATRSTKVTRTNENRFGLTHMARLYTGQHLRAVQVRLLIRRWQIVRIGSIGLLHDLARDVVVAER